MRGNGFSIQETSMASPTKRTTRSTHSGRARSTEGRRAKGQSDSARGTGAVDPKKPPRKRSQA
jgi:hypothetical protein